MIDMRLFRKKSDSPDHQEYLDGLITSIRKARREEEEKPGLHAFVEEDNFPVADAPGPPRVPPGVGNAGSGAGAGAGSEEQEEIANLEAYLSKLEADEAAAPQDEEDEQEYGSA
jgi:hypothetical protein